MARTAKRPCADEPETQRPRTHTKISNNTSYSSPSHLPTTEPTTKHIMDFNNENEREDRIMPSRDTADQEPDQAKEKETAAQKVFSMSEVVQIMLDDMTPKELFQPVRINRTFCDTIAQLPRFQHRMFLTPTKVYHQAERATNGYLRLSEPIELNSTLSSLQMTGLCGRMQWTWKTT
ncbi:hypothetical protein M409DRAFT_22244 [Zasmidium cellare ATCC 36951]|uniref:Uncharacterized protein n=1 Tax=Zasmidium cellare ATCC 36951 TaxID=1080233 RepID=A0A6A6CJV3_ZASCE|nr:uncharacterized protein M409DRAFT_22244 [Zasmidium cellare ATCC 36951]KAF2167435.1 hypothetical protein M409DRAFT_22244 [Zasmidium cellare ATCC 36951]